MILNAITTEDLMMRARHICANRDWRLLAYADLAISEKDFAGCMQARLQGWLEAGEHAEITEDLIGSAVINEYCRLLHQVIGQRDTPAGARALIEVWNYVTPIIRKILHDDDRAQDVAQNVLIKVREKRDTVRDPGSFLWWAGVIARHEAIRAAKAYGREVVMTDLSGDDDELAAEELEALLAAHASDPPGDDPGEGVRAAELEARIRECLRRIRHGAEVFIGLALRELAVSEISEQLGKKANAVYVIFHRARKRLQGCGPLLADLSVALEVRP